MAGKDWVKGFCERQGLSLRTLENISTVPLLVLTRQRSLDFSDNLKECYKKKGFMAHRIFNMDESGITNVPSKSTKIYTPKGKRTVCKIASRERGEMVTSVCCFSASRIYIPPILIFAGKRMIANNYDSAPEGSLNAFGVWLHEQRLIY